MNIFIGCSNREFERAALESSCASRRVGCTDDRVAHPPTPARVRGAHGAAPQAGHRRDNAALRRVGSWRSGRHFDDLLWFNPGLDGH